MGYDMKTRLQNQIRADILTTSALRHEMRSLCRQRSQNKKARQRIRQKRPYSSLSLSERRDEARLLKEQDRLTQGICTFRDMADNDAYGRRCRSLAHAFFRGRSYSQCESKCTRAGTMTGKQLATYLLPYLPADQQPFAETLANEWLVNSHYTYTALKADHILPMIELAKARSALTDAQKAEHYAAMICMQAKARIRDAEAGARRAQEAADKAAQVTLDMEAKIQAMEASIANAALPADIFRNPSIPERKVA